MDPNLIEKEASSGEEDGQETEHSDVVVPRPMLPVHKKQEAKALLILLFYSIMMFTLPFLVFYTTKTFLAEHYNIVDFSNTAISVLSAVITVNLIIVSYAMIGYYEKEYDDEGNEIERGSDVSRDKQD